MSFANVWGSAWGASGSGSTTIINTPIEVSVAPDVVITLTAPDCKNVKVRAVSDTIRVKVEET